MNQPNDDTAAIRGLIAEFERLGIRYYVGGSVASSYHGAGRSTLDIDVATELTAEQVRELAANLGSDYYLSTPAALDAVRRHSCFNVVHFASASKIDVFVSKDRDFDRSLFQRAATGLIPEWGSLEVQIASVEDIILLKLEWYRLGDEVSERQWRDVTLLAKLKRDVLDRAYLRQWAPKLGILDLLERVLAASGRT